MKYLDKVEIINWFYTWLKWVTIKIIDETYIIIGVKKWLLDYILWTYSLEIKCNIAQIKLIIN